MSEWEKREGDEEKDSIDENDESCQEKGKKECFK
jgi:hypothetical protein